MTYEQYVKKVKKEFAEYAYSEKQTEKYFSDKETIDILKEGYKAYADKDKDISAAGNPKGIAYSLDMLYE